MTVTADRRPRNPAAAVLDHDQARLREIAAVAPRPRRPEAPLNRVRRSYELLTRVRVIKARPLELTSDPIKYCQLRRLCPTGAWIIVTFLRSTLSIPISLAVQ